MVDGGSLDHGPKLDASGGRVVVSISRVSVSGGEGARERGAEGVLPR